MRVMIAVFALAAAAPAAGAADGTEAAPGDLGVAVAQPLVVPGDVARNVERMAPLVAEAARRGAKLVVFSECGLTGYDLKGVGARAALALNDPALDQVAGLARKHDIAIVAGFYEKTGDKRYNTAVSFLPDGKRVVQRKQRIFAPESDRFGVTPAPAERQYFEVAGFRCAVLICADAGGDGIHERLARDGCNAVILIAAGAGSERFGWRQADLGDPAHRQKYLQTALTCISPESVELSLKLNIAQVACNQAGWDAPTGYFHPGGSSIVDRTGAVAAVIPPRFVFEHLRPDLAVGVISKPTRTIPSTK